MNAWWALSCTAGELLRSVHGIGRETARGICRHANVAAGGSVGKLDDDHRERLAQLLLLRAQTGPQQRQARESVSTPRQRAAALEQACRTKAARRQVCRDIEQATDRTVAMTRIAGLVRARDRIGELKDMTIGDALTAVYGVGETRADKLCERAGISAGRTFAQLDRLSATRRRRVIDVLCDLAKDAAESTPDTGLDAAALLEWLDDLRLRPRSDSPEYAAISQARASGRISLAVLDRLLDRLDRQEMLAVLYPCN